MTGSRHAAPHVPPLALALTAVLGFAGTPSAAAAPSATAPSATAPSAAAPSNAAPSNTAYDSAQPAAVDPRWSDGVYVVQMSDPPVVDYAGGVPGYAATRPVAGAALDPAAPAVTRWVGRLVGEHSRALAGAGVANRLYDYAYAYNGFAARLTAAQAQRLRTEPGVLTVARQRTWTVDTTTAAPAPAALVGAASGSAALLGLDGPAGLWARVGGAGSAGEGVVVGVIDTGLWPESPAFADRVDSTGTPTRGATGRVAYRPLAAWSGRCRDAQKWDASACGGKVVAGRYFTAGQGGDAAVRRDRPWEFLSPRDYSGHGTATASTAVGNHAVPVSGTAAALAPDGLSGVAPRARVAVYKALWSTESGDTASGTTSDLVAAVDRAVADGVDVLSFSVGGTQSDLADPVEVALLHAASAGVFVATSAGNSGPSPSTVAHPSPWVTTVAAGTRGRDGTGSVTLGNGVTYAGAGLADREVTAPLIDATAAGRPGSDPERLAACASDADGGANLDPARVSGRIVVCQRGTTSRTNKSRAVAEAGGVGMVLVNTVVGPVDADLHAVPSVHLPVADRDAVRTYAATAGATATIHAATVTSAPSPHAASFSSRGPSRAAGGDLLKPDLVAPGEDVLAAVAPQAGSPATALRSGTSMSASQVAGLAALLGQLHPSWSPMTVKSALMTTGRDALDGTPADASVIFRQGAGHVRPDSAADPGLAYDSAAPDWLALLCGRTAPTGPAVAPATCATLRSRGYSAEASHLNTPSIALGELVGRRSVTRTVTNVGPARATYTASVDGLAGVATNVRPATLTLDPGASASFTVTLQRTDAPLGRYAGGSLRWTDGTHVVRSPIAVLPVALEAPEAVTAALTTPLTPPLTTALTTADSASAAASEVGLGAGLGAGLSAPPRAGVGVGADTSAVAGAPPGDVRQASADYEVGFGYDGPFAALARGPVAAVVTDGVVADDPTDSSCEVRSPNAVATPLAVPRGTTYARLSLSDADVAPGTDLDLCVFDATGALVGLSTSPTSQEEVDLVDPSPGAYRVVVQGREVRGVAPFRLSTWVLGSTATGSLTVDAPSAATTGDRGTVSVSLAGLGPGQWLGSVAYGTTAGAHPPTIVRVDVP